MNPNDPTPTETAVIRTTAAALLHLPPQAKLSIRASGHYGTHNRILIADFGPYDIGPMIGTAGGMKLAIQTILAWPMDADDCQLRIETKRIVMPPTPTQRTPRVEAVDAVLEAIAKHLKPYEFSHRTELSDTAVVAIVEAHPRITRDLRGPLSKLIRGIGRCQGYPAMIGLERSDSQAGRNAALPAR